MSKPRVGAHYQPRKEVCYSVIGRGRKNRPDVYYYKEGETGQLINSTGGEGRLLSYLLTLNASKTRTWMLLLRAQ